MLVSFKNFYTYTPFSILASCSRLPICSSLYKDLKSSKKYNLLLMYQCHPAHLRSCLIQSPVGSASPPWGWGLKSCSWNWLELGGSSAWKACAVSLSYGPFSKQVRWFQNSIQEEIRAGIILQAFLVNTNWTRQKSIGGFSKGTGTVYVWWKLGCLSVRHKARWNVQGSATQSWSFMIEWSEGSQALSF